ncbi:MAG: hypothetical protein HKN47_01050, partial [Pirellulaceae bacterium]|nr:hypothetical protein [Pirellulaceae bacterium]
MQNVRLFVFTVLGFTALGFTVLGFTALGFTVLGLPVSVQAADPPPLDPAITTLVPGITLTLVAEHPDVMTPTGIDVDQAGNLWFVCSHTHFRPEDYV